MNRRILLGALLLLTVVFTGYIVVNYRNAVTEFSIIRSNVVKNDLLGTRQYVDANLGYLFEDCENRDEYNSLININSLEMSSQELTRALELHNECGQFFVNRNRVTLELFKKEVERVEDASKMFPFGVNNNNVKIIATYWRDIYTLEKEHNDTFAELTNIQEEYWSVELKKVNGEMSAAEREGRFGELNSIAIQKLARIEAIKKELDALRISEADTWKGF